MSGPAATNIKVSHRGQASLPEGVDVARRELRRVLRDRYATGLSALDAPDLADQ